MDEVIKEVRNILVLGRKVPFTTGGQDILVNTLVKQLKQRKYNVDTIQIPFSTNKREALLDQAAIWRSMDLSKFGGEDVDLVICTNFPSYYARHPNKSLWLVHQLREIYDLYATRFSDFCDDPRDEMIRQSLVIGDTKSILECKVITGISETVVQRLKNYNGIKGATLYPPLPLENRYIQGDYENYILSVGRICYIKRVDYIIKALPTINSSVSLKIVGQPDESGIMDYLKNEIKKHHLTDRVQFLGRVTDEELLSLYSNALLVYYAPHEEDYGYVTLEAFASGKAVVTATDSGGVLEFVEDGVNGIITKPDIESMSSTINEALKDKDKIIRMGQNGLKLIEKINIKSQGWDKVISTLVWG